MMRGMQWMNLQTHWEDDMEINEALIKLEAHERECLLRYESIQRQLDEHNKRFDKLDAALNRQLVIMIGILPVVIGFVEYLR